MNIRITVLVFSGRPDPSWELKAAAADKIVQRWEKLQSISGVRFPEPKLGYQGCRIELSADKFIILFNGYGYLSKNGKQVSQKRDPDRETEKLALHTAPPAYRELVRDIMSH